MQTNQYKDRIIAGGVTLFATGLILLFLFLGRFSYNADLLTSVSSQTPDSITEEEIFLEPEILKELGETDAVTNDRPAPAYQGEPEPSETDNTKLVVPGKNPKPAPPVDKLVSTDKESSVKTTEPTVSKEERQKVTSSIAKGFSGRNGASEGSTSKEGAGSSGTGISGTAAGRTFQGCPAPNVSLQHRTTVVVTVVIDSNGRVTSAKASGGASAEIRRACEAAAKKARWNEKPDAPESRGSITFTITPR